MATFVSLPTRSVALSQIASMRFDLEIFKVFDRPAGVDSKGVLPEARRVERCKTHQGNEAFASTAAQRAFRSLCAFFAYQTAFLRVIRSPTPCGEFREAPLDCPRGTAAAEKSP